MATQPPRLRFSSFNAPKPIFLGWTAMVVVAAGGYVYAKKTNTAKQKKVMREKLLAGLSPEERQREEIKLARRDQMKSEQESASGPHGKQMSPWQSLVNQFGRNVGGGASVQDK